MTKSKTTSQTLPNHVQKSDTVAPKWDSKEGLPFSEAIAVGLDDNRLRFYRTAANGWILLVLRISNASKRQAPGTSDRYYGIGVNDSKIYTVGRGPHVLEELTVHLTKSNVERLRPLIDLFIKGNTDANTIRDRISSRRAQGALRRQSFGGLFY